jgi:hypothetical protein
MDLGKYKKAMRPKKYLDGRFVIYDETIPDASDAQLGAREEFKDGSKQYDYKNPQQKNQYITRTDEEIQSIVDDPKYANYTRKDFRNEKILTRKETERKGVTFKNIGARKSTKDPNEKNIRRTEKIKKTQGANISVKGSGQTGKQFSHVYPLIESAKPGTKTTFIIDAQMNRDLLGYNKIGQEIAEQQELLIKNKPDGYKEEIVKLNAQAKKNVMNAIRNLGKEYKGQIGYFQVDPETGEFKPKAGNYKMSFAGIEGENKVYKDMTGKERKDFERKISAIEKAKTIPGVTTADKIQRPESAMTREMFNRFNKLKGVLIPGLEEIKDSLKKLPDDIKSKRYFTAALKGLGIVATPLIVSGMYNDFKSGKTVMETLERNLIGTDAVGGMKDIFALSPEEREARSVVKQAEMDEQIAQDFSGLDTDFQTPRVESKMSLEEALKEYEEGLKRVELERQQEEAERAEGRASSFESLKDLMLGERFQPQEIPQQFLASGGRVGFADGTPPDPSKRKFMKIMGALAAVPVIGKYFNLAKPLTKAAPAAVEAVKGIPPYFFKMVEKIKQYGDDVSKRFATQEKEQVYNYRTSDADYELIEDLNTGDTRLKVIKGDPDFPGYKEQELTLTKGKIDETTGSVPDQYDEYTVRSDFDGKMKDIDEGIEGIDDLIEDTIGFENVSIKELEDMGYDVNRLSPDFKKKLGIK